MKVRDAMAKTISTASRNDALKKVAEMMKQEDTGFIPVTDGNALVGVITDRDIVIKGLTTAGDNFASEPVEHYMSREVATINADADLEEAARLMAQREVRRLPVVEQDGKLVGVLSHGNLVQATQSEGPGDKATLGVTQGA